ncbi:UNVERIFIED_CONTAM: hypothetical protein K2H54_036187 [Gekko kuhli]
MRTESGQNLPLCHRGCECVKGGESKSIEDGQGQKQQTDPFFRTVGRTEFGLLDSLLDHCANTYHLVVQLSAITEARAGAGHLTQKQA